MTAMPAYIDLYRSGRLKKIAAELRKRMAHCDLCPRRCGVNRNRGEHGFCRTGALAAVSSACAHYGEEPPLVGRHGVGNIFFTQCNLRCVFCQNHQISQVADPVFHYEASPEQLADYMLDLQRRGCHSIGLVSPTHVIATIVEAVCIATEKGLYLPLIYNSSAYDRAEILALLEGLFDIYLPDLKYADDRIALQYSSAINYTSHARSALREMYRQNGYLLHTDEYGIVIRGLIIRHLILPNRLAGTEHLMNWIATELHPEIHISLMAQYYPAHQAVQYPEINRSITQKEYEEAVHWLIDSGLHNGWIQDLQSRDFYRPDFTNKNAPFR